MDERSLIPGRGRHIYLHHHAQYHSEVYRSSYPMAVGGFLPVVKWTKRGGDRTYYLVPKFRNTGDLASICLHDLELGHRGNFAVYY
jgi:hypothetical protein